jgi:hypothetical protein
MCAQEVQVRCAIASKASVSHAAAPRSESAFSARVSGAVATCAVSSYSSCGAGGSVADAAGAESDGAAAGLQITRQPAAAENAES